MGHYGPIVVGLALAVSSLVAFSLEAEATSSENDNVTETLSEKVYPYPYYCVRCSCMYVNTTYGSFGLFSNCSSRSLYLPIFKNTVELNLQQLNLFRVKAYYFIGLERLEILDLSNNIIRYLHVNAFRDLHSLKTLYLHSNDFLAISSALITGVFSSLGNLTYLTLHDCIHRYSVNSSVIISRTFADLVSLEFLSIDGTYMMQFDEGFKQLSQLKTLVLSGEHGACEINALTNATFAGIENIENLTLSSCRIKTIHRETFASLRKLRFLDLSRNPELEIDRFGEAAYGLTFTNVSVLKIISIHEPKRAGSELLRQDMRYFRDLPLTELYMDENAIEYVEYGVFDRLPTSLKYLSLKKNKLTFSIYINEVVFNNPNLSVIDATDQVVVHRTYPTSRIRKKYRNKYERKKIAFDPGTENEELDSKEISRERRDAKRNIFSDIHDRAMPAFSHLNPALPVYRYIAGGRARLRNGNLRLEDERNMDRSTLREKRGASETEQVTLALQKLMCTGSMSNVLVLDFAGTINNITFMDLSRNFIPMLKGYEFLGLPKLTHLNLSSNYIEIVSDPDGFRDLVDLEVLDLRDNLLGKVLEENVAIFSHLSKLVHLNLSRNRVNKIGDTALGGLHMLWTLDLSENYLSDFNVDLSDLHNIYELDLSDNRIHSVCASTRKSLDRIAHRRDIMVDLSHNDFSCNCDTIPFLHWLIESPVSFLNFDNYLCSLNNGSIRYLNASESMLYALEEECRSYLLVTVVGATGGSFAVAFVLSYFVYRNRWKIRYLYYMAKVKIDGHKEEHNDAHFDYDVFLSYADHDREFVTKEMVQHIENDQGIRLCIRDRDFEVGEVVAVNISKAIRTSKKTVLLVSRFFLKNKWCNFEMNMARMEAIHMQRKVLVVVFLEQIPANVLPLELIDILREYPNTDVPNDEQVKPAFWQTCLGFFQQ